MDCREQYRGNTCVATQTGWQLLTGGAQCPPALAYSRGLDSSVIVTWLKENCGLGMVSLEMVSLAADLGQGDGQLKGMKEKAPALEMKVLP